ncbi:MAG TPA: hypothetical protein ENH11_04370 [Candidatus Acetothermia bacterium]|nr:hypothetical protein [Candidatus Acetothermia bacterium]
MSSVTIKVTVTVNGIPTNGLVDAPEIVIRRTDTGAITQASTAMTDHGGDGLYVYEYSFALTDGLKFSFLIDTDPQVTGQVPTAERYFEGTFEHDFKEKLLRNRQVLNSATGRVEVYDEADVGIELTADVFLDEDGLVPYDGSAGVVRRDRFV